MADDPKRPIEGAEDGHDPKKPRVGGDEAAPEDKVNPPQDGKKRAQALFPELYARKERIEKKKQERLERRSRDVKLAAVAPRVTTPSLADLRNKKNVKWILSLDGGGVRGLISAKLLENLQLKLGDDHNIVDYFDMVCGTSTGGIISLALGVGGLPLEDVVEMYLNLGDQIFRDKSSWRFYKDLVFGNDAVIYPNATEELKAQLKAKLKAKFLKLQPGDKGPKVFVVSTDQRVIQSPKIVLLRNYENKETQFESISGLPAVDAGLATSAAPTYFKPVVYGGYELVDGGTLANDPAAIAYAEALKLWPKSEIRILSIGTGDITNHKAAPRELFDQILSYSGGMELSQNLIKQMLRSEDRFFRLNPKLGEDIPLDGTGDEFQNKMLDAAKSMTTTKEFGVVFDALHKAASE